MGISIDKDIVKSLFIKNELRVSDFTTRSSDFSLLSKFNNNCITTPLYSKDSYSKVCQLYLVSQCVMYVNSYGTRFMFYPTILKISHRLPFKESKLFMKKQEKIRRL